MSLSKRYQRAARIFSKVCDLEGSARDQALDRACLNDEALRREVVSLLSYHEQKRNLAPASGRSPRRKTK